LSRMFHTLKVGDCAPLSRLSVTVSSSSFFDGTLEENNAMAQVFFEFLLGTND
jgi:hypothetical protein